MPRELAEDRPEDLDDGRASSRRIEITPEALERSLEKPRRSQQQGRRRIKKQGVFF